MDLKKIEKFIDKQKVSFICSIDDENCPNIKAMLKPRKRIGLKVFYKGLMKYIGVMLKGKMEVLTDQETKNMIWKKGDTMFYKKGVTDPDYCVLKFTAASGRYYCDLKTENFDI